MARRRKPREDDPDNHDRWMVSYADFVTLLLGFFVVMYAISSVNEGRYRAVSQALEQAFQTVDKKTATPSVVQPIQQDHPKSERQKKMQGMADNIRSVLDPLVREGHVRVNQTARGIAVEINANALFAPGQAELNDGAARTLILVASVLAGAPNGIEVEGHTDDSPISNPVFPSNWELSAARSSRVVRIFAQNGVSPERMAAVGYGEHRSIDSNQTPEGRARNRRVTVVILPLEEDTAGTGSSPQ